MPSTVSDRPLASTGDPTATPVSVGKAHHKPRNYMPPATPGTSNSVQPVIVSPEDVRPLAKAAPRDNSRKRKSGNSAVYTDTPVKNQVTIASVKKSRKSAGKNENAGKTAKRSLKLMKKSDEVKKGGNSDEDSSDDTDTEVLQQMEKDMEQSNNDNVSDVEAEEKLCPDIGELQIDDHILVKFTGKFYIQLT